MLSSFKTEEGDVCIFTSIEILKLKKSKALFVSVERLIFHKCKTEFGKMQQNAVLSLLSFAFSWVSVFISIFLVYVSTVMKY